MRIEFTLFNQEIIIRIQPFKGYLSAIAR